MIAILIDSHKILQWLTGDWHQLMPPWLANIILAVIASFCGAIVGTERERKEKPTGTRTLSLVSVGSSVFTMLSINAGMVDGRMAAQIISGVGFLGAGAIIRGRFGVVGLTSAATIWVAAAIGMTVGFGYAFGGLALSLFVLAVLTFISGWEQRYVGACMLASVKTTYDPAGGKTLVRIEGLLDEFEVPGMCVKEHSESPDHLTGAAMIHYCHVHKHHRELLARIAEMTEVHTIQRDDKALH